jgi:hypothetical protein
VEAPEVAVRRPVRVLLAALLALVVTAPAASAEPRGGRLKTYLGDLWTSVIETPLEQGPFGGGDPCVVLPDGTVAPFVLPGDQVTSCSVEPGTPVFVVLWSSECSTAEVGTIWYARNPGDARRCARETDAGITYRSITLDGVPIPYTEVESRVMRVRVPAGNVFGVPAQQAVSVAHGWVTMLEDLAPGTHTIVIEGRGTYPDADGDGEPDLFEFTTVTTLVVG